MVALARTGWAIRSSLLVKLRSCAELIFRLRQEGANLWLGFGPASGAPPTARLPLGQPETFLERLCGTPYADRLLAVAEGVLRREFPLLGISIQTGREIRWRRDYLQGRESGLAYFRCVPYLDATQVGDHKIIWELNRHQHLVTLAQAHCLCGRSDFLEDLWEQLDGWMDQNPFCRGMNWASALEVAFRALSWLWIEHLVGGRMPDPLRRRWLLMLYRHGRYLEHNLSIYFSPNTHLQGEALALHALGVLFQGDPRAARWRRTGAAILEEIIQTHVRPDGGHFEQSSYYHVYATDMFLFHALFENVSAAYLRQLRKMAEYLWALSSSGEMPLLGDDDGGRLFHPYGARREFARATLASCAVLLGDTPWHENSADLQEQALWWFGPRDSPVRSGRPPSSALFPDTGVAVLVQENVQVIVDTRGFGSGGAGHSHAHALHFTLRCGGVDVLIDPGTYTYVSDPAWRSRFRGTAAHNTVRVDGLDQADPAGSFRWNNLPHTELRQWSDQPWRLHALCRYRGITHNRQMAWIEGSLFVLDYFQSDGDLPSQGVHRLEQLWHPAGPVRTAGPSAFELPGGVFLSVPETSSAHLEEGGDHGWYSPALGSKSSRPLIRVEREAGFPCSLAAAFVFPPSVRPAPLRTIPTPGGIALVLGDQQTKFLYD